MYMLLLVEIYMILHLHSTLLEVNIIQLLHVCSIFEKGSRYGTTTNNIFGSTPTCATVY
jgi:hypothetical protein